MKTTENSMLMVENVSMAFKLKKKSGHRVWPFARSKALLFYALKNINFEIKKGELVSVIGRNGSGKSTLARIISGIFTPTTGRVLSRKRVTSIFSLGGSFQRNNDLTGRQNILNFCNHNAIPKNKHQRVTDEVIEVSELGQFIDQPVSTYSAGMKGRLSFSLALFIKGEILVLDEVLSAGDAAFTKKAGSILTTFKDRGTTIIYITHSIQSARTLSSRVLWLHEGEIKLLGTPDIVCDSFKKFIYSASGPVRGL